MKASFLKTSAACILTLVVPTSWVHAGGQVFDESVTWNNSGTSGFYIQQTTDPELGPTGSSNLDPTITLRVGFRYQFANTNSGSHPFSLVAHAVNNNPSQDSQQLSQHSGVAALEGDGLINFADSGNAIYFTVTPRLIDGMNGNSQQVPGYRCNIHESSMNGRVSFSGPSAQAVSDFLTGSGELPTAADLSYDGLVDAADVQLAARLFP